MLEEERLFKIEKEAKSDVYYNSERYYQKVEKIINNIREELKYLYDSDSERGTYNDDYVDKMKKKLINNLNKLIEKKNTAVLRRVISYANKQFKLLLIAEDADANEQINLLRILDEIWGLSE